MRVGINPTVGPYHQQANVAGADRPSSVGLVTMPSALQRVRDASLNLGRQVLHVGRPCMATAVARPRHYTQRLHDEHTAVVLTLGAHEVEWSIGVGH